MSTSSDLELVLDVVRLGRLQKNVATGDTQNPVAEEEEAEAALVIRPLGSGNGDTETIVFPLPIAPITLSCKFLSYCFQDEPNQDGVIIKRACFSYICFAIRHCVEIA